MEWTHSSALRLINLYREREYLWNPKSPDYKYKSKRHGGWLEISELMNCHPTEVRKKFESLMTSFRRERQKVEADENYHCCWYAYKSMQFLLDRHSGKSVYTERQPLELAEAEEEYHSQDLSPDDHNYGATQNSYDTADVFVSSVTVRDDQPYTPPPQKLLRLGQTRYDRPSEVNAELSATLSELREAVRNPLPTAASTARGTEFDVFGMSVAAQLNNMPWESAIELQSQIQTLITNFRLQVHRNAKLES